MKNALRYSSKLVILLCFTFSISCSNNSKNDGGGNGGDTGAVGQFRSDKTSGGCRIRLASPKHGQTIDLRNGNAGTLEWTTDGTTCETPWTLYVAGLPFSNERTAALRINTNGSTITTKGGIVTFTAADIANLPSDGDVYHWTIESFYGSSPASISFKVLK